MDKFTITELEQAINRIRNAYPPVENRLAPDTKVLAKLYGEMIYLGLSEIPSSSLSEKQSKVFTRWRVGS